MSVRQVFKVVAGLIVVLLIGSLVTRLLVRTTPTPPCVRTEVALLMDNPVERLILNSGATITASSGVRFTVVVYTLFRIPYAKLEIDCANGGSGRVLWRIIG